MKFRNIILMPIIGFGMVGWTQNAKNGEELLKVKIFLFLFFGIVFEKKKLTSQDNN